MYRLLAILFVNILLTYADDLCPKIVSRKEWGANNVTDFEILKKPVKYVIIHHTEPDLEGCSSESDCIKNIKEFRELNSEKRRFVYSHDVGYNFLIGGDGRAYEGMGWGIIGQHTNIRYNPLSIGIGFMGRFDDNLPSEPQLEIVKKLIACGVSLGEISKEYKLVPARYVTYVWSPGNLISNELANWPHYASRNDIINS